MSVKREKIAAKDVHMKTFSFHISERTQKSSEEEIDPFPMEHLKLHQNHTHSFELQQALK